jgi:hypothetical protein
MKMGEGKNILIKNYTSGNINMPFRGIQTLEAFVRIAIPEKHTPF